MRISLHIEDATPEELAITVRALTGSVVVDPPILSPAPEHQEEPVQAVATMTPEEVAVWEEELAEVTKQKPTCVDCGQLTKGGKRCRSCTIKAIWTPEKRAAAAQRAREMRLGKGPRDARGKRVHVAEPAIDYDHDAWTPPTMQAVGMAHASPVYLTNEAENAASLDTAIEVKNEATTPLQKGSTPNEEAHIPREVQPVVDLSAISEAAFAGPKADARRATKPSSSTIAHLVKPEPSSQPKEALPPCTCPGTWWTDANLAMGANKEPSWKHYHGCPLHRHKHRFPTMPNAEGYLTGRCECGHVEKRRPEYYETRGTQTVVV